MNVYNIRREFCNKWIERDIIFVRGSNTIEIIGASFLANEETIFGEPNSKYIEAEIEWYKTQSLTIMENAPQGWQDAADMDGNINSNYGWCLNSEENCSQRKHVVAELRKNPHSRRAIVIYTRPSMHLDAFEDGKNDFICTNTVQYLLRQGRLHCIVQMRSNDAILGYRNDYAWQKLVLQELATELRVHVGSIYWQVGSLHIYERHFHYLEQPCLF